MSTLAGECGADHFSPNIVEDACSGHQVHPEIDASQSHLVHHGAPKACSGAWCRIPRCTSKRRDVYKGRNDNESAITPVAD